MFFASGNYLWSSTHIANLPRLTEKVRRYLYPRLPLLFILVVFVVLKWPHLSYPYYWDESWSYAPGVRLMYLHGPTLLPGEIDSYYSRGHPLFFYASAASWLKFFGDSHFSRHAFALFVACLALWLLYECCLRFMSWRVALIATVLLAAQVMFFVQASYVLPEIMVALFCFGALFFFAAGRYLYAAITLAALFQTKESGLVIGVVLGCAALAMLFQRSLPLKQKGAALAAVGVPTLLISAFFGVQRLRVGWFLYPEHTAMIKWEWGHFYMQFRNCLDILFYQDNRHYLFGLLLPGAVYAMVKKQYRLGAVLLPALISYWIITSKGLFLGEKSWFVLWIVAIVVAAWSLCNFLIQNAHPALARMVALTTAAFTAYLCFCCLNFFTNRYLLPALVITIFWFALLFWLLLLLRSAHWAWYTLAAALPVAWAFRDATGHSDVELGSFPAMRVQQRMVDFLEQNDYYAASIGGGPFQDIEHLTKPMTGFLRSERAFTKVRWEIDSATQIAFFNNIEPDKRYEEVAGDASFKRIYRDEEGGTWAEIYERVR